MPGYFISVRRSHAMAQARAALCLDSRAVAEKESAALSDGLCCERCGFWLGCARGNPPSLKTRRLPMEQFILDVAAAVAAGVIVAWIVKQLDL